MIVHVESRMAAAQGNDLAISNGRGLWIWDSSSSLFCQEGIPGLTIVIGAVSEEGEEKGELRVQHHCILLFSLLNVQLEDRGEERIRGGLSAEGSTQRKGHLVDH